MKRTQETLNRWELARLRVAWRPPRIYSQSQAPFHVPECRHAPTGGRKIEASFKMAARMVVPPCLTCLPRYASPAKVVRVWSAAARSARVLPSL